MAQRPITHRTVKPRKTGYQDKKIIAVSMETGEIFLERTGEILPFDQLATLIATEASSIIATANAGALLKYLDDKWSEDPRWQFRITPVNQEIYGPNRKKRRTVTKRTVVAFFGFRAMREKGNRKQASLYHYPVEPDSFIGKTITELRPGDEPRVIKLLKWAKDIREFLKENDLAVRPTSGGIAGQLLKDERFYPEDRRKVPRSTNRRARDQLPGNYYRLFVPENSSHTATYLDQKSAHHSCALDIEFPDADYLYAKGHFYNPKEKPMALSGTKRFDRLISEYGLFLLRITVPTPVAGTFPLPCMEETGTHIVFAFSNELEDIRATGGHIEAIIAQWTSRKAETGLNQYAKWSLAQLADADEFRRAWLKPLLLATYGILAAKPKPIEIGYKRAKSGEDGIYPVGAGVVKVRIRKTDTTHEMPTANVIHRGMIEAETRLRSLRLAREFHKRGAKVLAIYADSIFIEGTLQLSLHFLDERWQVKGELARLKFFNSTSFTSDVLTKLPGIPKQGLDEVRRLERFRSKAAANSSVVKERKRLRIEENIAEPAEVPRAVGE